MVSKGARESSRWGEVIGDKNTNTHTHTQISCDQVSDPHRTGTLANS